MSSVILASLIGRGTKQVKPPTLITVYDYTQKGKDGGGLVAEARPAIIPKSLIRPGAVSLIKSLLEAPLCYQAAGTSYGTLKSLSQWCARRRGDLRLHFAKTGTSVSLDPNATVDAWVSGGLQFTNGAAYSYVVLVGTGTASQPWAHDLHAAQIAAPLLDVLLRDLAGHAKSNPRRDLLPSKPRTPATARISAAPLAAPHAETLASKGTSPRERSPADEQLRALSPN